MLAKILLIQVRDDNSRLHEQEKIIEAIQLDSHRLHIINALTDNDAILRKLSNSSYAGIIIGGSGQYNISDWSKKIEAQISRIEFILARNVALDLPTIGICFGHQLLAHWFGGSVSKITTMAETGTPEISLTPRGSAAPLYYQIPQSIRVVTSHQDSVIVLPSNAVLLASSVDCPIQSFRLNRNIYGVQFHPELDKSGLLWRLNLYSQYLPSKQKKVNQIYQNTPNSKKIIANFVKLALNQ